MFRFRRFHYLILGILSVSAFLVWLAVFEQSPSNLEVRFFDVGSGDSIFIETPHRRQVLIDGGPDLTVLEKLGQVMPFYDKTLDLVILTHPEADHLTGLIGTIDRYQIGRVIISGAAKETALYQKWAEELKEKDIKITLAQAGQKIILDQGVFLNIFWPQPEAIDSLAKKVNNTSIVSQLVYGQTEILLTGDIESSVERQLVNLLGQGLDSDVLKVAHHGSKTSSQSDFIKAVSPEAAIISVALKNRYGHPNQEVLERLAGIKLFQTSLEGDISIFGDGTKYWIETAR